MELGFSLPCSGSWATPHNQVRIAQAAERLGYHRLWTLQRLMRPVEPQNDYPPLAGQPWPATFEITQDPIVTLAHVAASTSTIGLGTAVLVAPYYPPLLLGKQLATLDQVAGGRLAVGLGLGWSKDEYEAVGVPFARRGARMDEFVRCLRRVLSDDVVEFHGEFYDIPASRVEPKPLQRPSPPLLIGGYGKKAMRRAAALGDGFVGGNLPLPAVRRVLDGLESAYRDAGRDVSQARVASRGAVQVFSEPQGADRRPLFGTLGEIRDDIARYRDAGIDELFLELNFDPAIGGPDADPEATTDYALDVLAELAPDAS
ncbi:putative F420-dependent oxidoreductase [Lipingzhangella halophila]|uniref:Putative F420-dependent oxidoreductase n=1 Tax=Lipingzhangella halophila TaxID=1783352 RepID=A0A7W7RPP0_9ACTN|nr:LLM class F420-dependent oxidoreductase [Lipingzhangella halophila]MBB4935291.1 putative F420-dependent oxidoreductase [Lipingzhangella halophila]